MGDTVKEQEDPWVCPNDRELSLRAKLSSGWSFYTNRQQTGKKQAVKKKEKEIIERILKKSEDITLREEYRIGHLVDRLENIKNNAQGNGVTTCLLCDEKFGKLTTSPMKCNICEKAACGKCGVDTISSGNVPIWLCKLCNEQREFWKKSGAWFFRQMPQHRLPSSRERYLTSGSFVVATPELSRKGNLLSQASELYSDSDQESSPSSEELLDDEHRHPPKRQGMLGPTDQRDAAPPPPPRHSPLMRVQDNQSLSRSRTPSPALPERRKGSHFSLQLSSHDTSDDDDQQSSKGSRILRHSPVHVQRNKRTSITPSSGTGSPGSQDRDSVGNFLNHEENVEEMFQTYGSDYKLSGPLGVIEFTLNYLKDVKRLDVHIHNAKGLRAMDSTGTSDPYVKLHLLPGASKSNKMRTRTLRKTLDPLFNEVLSYHGITEEDMKNKTLRLQVLDEDRLRRNDFIGQTTVPLKQVLNINNRKMQKVLEPKAEAEFEDVGNSNGQFGRINISLRYLSKDEKLLVGIIRCANLVAMDTNGYSDPYVKWSDRGDSSSQPKDTLSPRDFTVFCFLSYASYLLPDPSKKTKRRTKIKKRNLNPEFNEMFTYKISHNELANKTLEITVWDHDVGKSNDFIGGIHLGIHAKDSLLRQWFETLKRQNEEITYWHNLRRDITLQEAD